MTGQMAIAIGLNGFNDLGHSMTPIFPLKDHFLYRFSMFQEKKLRKSINQKFEFFCKNTCMPHRILLFLGLCLSVWQSQDWVL